MGVYYSAYLVYGLRVTEEDAGDQEWWEWLEDTATPPGFSYIQGGNLMSGSDDDSAVICKDGHTISILDGIRDEGFGIYKVDRVFQVAPLDKIDLFNLARRLGIPEERWDAGYFAVTSVG